MLRVLISGINGKMGQIVKNIVNKDLDSKVFGGIDIIEQSSEEYNVYSDPFKFEDIPDVIIDFSLPNATMNLLDYAKKKRVPLVIATTGFNEEQLKIIKDYSKYIPIFQSANMSYEINLLAHILKQVTPLLDDSNIEIVETHHNRKIDSPSGTAILLADKINESVDNKLFYEFNRHDKHEKRAKNEIGFSSIRGGNIVGEHSVLYFSENETLEFKHTAYDRSVFAKGALKAAKFIITKESGLYNMDDLM